MIRIEIDTRRLEGRLDLVGRGIDPCQSARLRIGQPDSRPAAQPAGSGGPRHDLPDDTRLWAALQAVGGGTWGGCVYDVDRIVELLERGRGQSRRERRLVAGDRTE